MARNPFETKHRTPGITFDVFSGHLWRVHWAREEVALPQSLLLGTIFGNLEAVLAFC